MEASVSTSFRTSKDLQDSYRTFLCGVYLREKISIEHSRAATIRTREYPGVTARQTYRE